MGFFLKMYALAQQELIKTQRNSLACAAQDIIPDDHSVTCVDFRFTCTKLCIPWHTVSMQGLLFHWAVTPANFILTQYNVFLLGRIVTSKPQQVKIQVTFHER